MAETAATSQMVWTAVMVAERPMGSPSGWSTWNTKTPRETDGVASTLSSVGILRAVGPSHVQP
jgi:hypothetical protein